MDEQREKLVEAVEDARVDYEEGHQDELPEEELVDLHEVLTEAEEELADWDKSHGN